MDSKPIRYPRRISFGLNRGPHRGPYVWEIEPTPQEAEERKRRQAERALVYVSRCRLKKLRRLWGTTAEI